MRVCQFSCKTNSFDFFSPNLLKSGSTVGNSENYCRNKNQHPRYTMCANFPSKWTTLNFSGQIWPKKDLEFEIEKNNVGIRINIIETFCVSIFSQTALTFLAQQQFTALTFLAQISPKMDLGSDIQKTNVGIRISIVKMPCAPILRQNGQLWVFGPKFAQKWVLGSKFQNS